jgi:hypothetical protein
MTDLSVASKSALEQESVTWAARARGLRIVDAASCVSASQLLRSIKGLRTEIANWFAPHLEAAMETKRKAEAARKGLADEQGRMEAPLLEAEGVVKRALLAWETEQERARRAEEQRLQAEAQREAETVTLAAAAALEREAIATGDLAMRQEAEDILAQPIDAPVVSVASFTPNVQGVTYRDNWKAHPEVDVLTLAAAVVAGQASQAFLTVNMTALNTFAKATKGTHPVAGVRFWNDRQIAARG